MDAFIVRTKAVSSSINAGLDKSDKFSSGQAKDDKEQADDLIMIDDNGPTSTTGADGGHLGKSVMGGDTSPCPAKSAPAIEAKTPPTESKLKPALLAKRSAPLAAPSGSGEGDVKKKKSKPSRVGGKTLEQRRRELGDSVKGRIQVEKWCVAAQTHCTVSIVSETFRELVVPNAVSVTPSTFTQDTPVVVAYVTRGAGEIFGSSKITGGTRMGSWRADKMELVFFPKEEKMRCWWTMS